MDTIALLSHGAPAAVIAYRAGVPVTAHDYVFSYRRMLDPKTAAQYAALLYPIKGAEAVNAGQTTYREAA